MNNYVALYSNLIVLFYCMGWQPSVNHCHCYSCYTVITLILLLAVVVPGQGFMREEIMTLLR